MATKYAREDSVERAREAHRVSFKREDKFGVASYKRRLIIIYLGILVVVALMFAAGPLGAKNPFLGRSVLRGEGVVIGKETRGDPSVEIRHFLRIRMSLEDGGQAEDLAEIDAEHWQAFKEDDRVAVLYQLSRDGRRVRIRECGLVALTNGIR